MPDTPRIAELRRRVESDPASIAFAQLAEEHRREGEYQQAVTVCRTGLAQYPGFLSARITLGRSLGELGQFDAAADEFRHVLRTAPDNLAAQRAFDELKLRAAAAGHPLPARRDRALEELESWLQAILDDRARRSSTHASS